MARILVIEDNADLAYGLEHNLSLEGHEVRVAGDGTAGMEEAVSGWPALIVLDLMLPGMDGFELLEELRRRDRRTPVLILSARGEELDKVRGLRGGADDYMVKPFGLMELLARVDVLLGREAARRAVRASFGEMEIDVDAGEVRLRGSRVELTPKEFDLLVALIRADGATLTRVELLREVWGHAGEVQSRTVDTHMAELRRKLEADPTKPQHLLTVRKKGYRFQR